MKCLKYCRRSEHDLYLDILLDRGDGKGEDARNNVLSATVKVSCRVHQWLKRAVFMVFSLKSIITMTRKNTIV